MALGLRDGLASCGKLHTCKNMDAPGARQPDFAPVPRYPNGERKLARDPFMQATWALLGAAILAQLFLLGWLDVMS